MVIAVAEPARVFLARNCVCRDLCFYRTEFKRRTGANFRPIKLTDSDVFASAAASNRVTSIRMVGDYFVAPNAKCLPRATVVRATHLAVAIKAVVVNYAARDRSFRHAVCRNLNSDDFAGLRSRRVAIVGCVKFCECRPQVAEPSCEFLRINLINLGCRRLAKLLEPYANFPSPRCFELRICFVVMVED